MEKLLVMYLKLRDALAKETEAYEQRVGVIKAGMSKIESAFLETLLKPGAPNSMNFGFGIVAKTTKRSVTVADWSKFLDHVIATQKWELLGRHASKSEVLTLVDDKQPLPPGLNFYAETALSIQRRKAS
jgi:hypothetical protein